jgi:hypothetical protein
VSSTFRNSFLAGLLIAFIGGIWLSQLWGAENQVRLHSEHLLQKVERRSWSAVDGFLAPNYHDDWGDDRAALLTRLRLVGRLFFDLTITISEERTEVSGADGRWSARLHLDGRGEAAAEIKSRVNSLTSPFVFHWRRASWKPWDWKLLKVANDSLEIPDEGR